MIHAWEATAAYFYLLHLDRLAIAWEYLRRNQDYRRDWRQRESHPEAASKWGCQSLEDPNFDARSATPQWLDTPTELVEVVRANVARPRDYRFSIWNFHETRELCHLGTHLCFRSNASTNGLQVRMDVELSDGEPYAFVVRADGMLRERLRVVEQAAEQIQGASTRINLAKCRRVDRIALTHARALQALDGVQAGASHRDIAIALFGVGSVKARWSADGELRAQVRYLLRRGQALMNGGYRALVLPDGNAAQGDI